MDDTRGTPRRHVLRARRSHAASDPRAARRRGGLGQGAGGTLRDQPARDLEAPQGAGTGGADLGWPGRAAAATPDPRPATRRGEPVAGALPAVLGGQLPPPRRSFGRAEDAGQAARPREKERGEEPMSESSKLLITTPSDRELRSEE